MQTGPSASRTSNGQSCKIRGCLSEASARDLRGVSKSHEALAVLGTEQRAVSVLATVTCQRRHAPPQPTDSSYHYLIKPTHATTARNEACNHERPNTTDTEPIVQSHAARIGRPAPSQASRSRAVHGTRTWRGGFEPKACARSPRLSLHPS